MKIMIVTPYFYPKVGGLENYALNIALGLKKQGNDVLIVTTNHEGKGRKVEKVKGLHIIRLHTMFKISNTPINPLWRWQLRKIIKQEKPNIINAHTPVPYISDMVIRAAKRTPVTLTYHNDLIKEKGLGKYLAKAFNLLYTNKSLKKARGIIATSQYYADNSQYLKKNLAKVSVVSPGIDSKRFNNKVDKTWLKKQYTGKKILLFVGNMDKTHAHKGIDVLIKAVAKARITIPNLQVLMIGKGDGIPDYKEICKKYDVSDNFSFLGFIKDKDLPKYYAGSDVLVLPSTTAAEGFGMVIIEAAACGTPAIGTRIGGIPYAISDYTTGILCKPKSITDLTNKIIDIFNDDIFTTLVINASSSSSDVIDWDNKTLTTQALFLNNLFPVIYQISAHYPPYLGGLEKVTENISKNLAARDYEVEVITSTIQSKNNKDSVRNNLNIVRLKGSEIFNVPIIWNLFPYLLKTNSNSIFHVHISQLLFPEIALLAAKIKKIPTIAHLHSDTQPSSFFGFIFVIYKKLIFPITLRNYDKIIVLTSDHFNMIVNKYKVNPTKIYIIPNGISQEYFTKTNRSLHSKPRLLYAGRLSTEKNIEQLLLSLVGISHKYDTKIVGSGPEFMKLKMLSTKLKLSNVSFPGRLDGNKLLSTYLWADIFILPSRGEGMPLTLLEAMATKLPCIGTDVSGIRSLINSKNGLLVKLDDIQDMKNSIVKLTSTEKYSMMSENALQTANEYRWDTVIDSIVNLYQKMIQIHE